MSDFFHKTRGLGWLAGLVALISLAGISDRDLWTPDEPRDASVALWMSRAGNVVVPYLAGEPFVEKPPLYFAVAAGFARLLGPYAGYAGAIRFSSAAWGLLTLGVVFFLGRRLWGVPTGLWGVIVLATMAGFVENMHWIRVDPALVFFVTASLWAFAEVYLGGRPNFCVWAGLFAAGAFLAKGVIGPMLIAVGWCGLAFPWLFAQRARGGKAQFHVLPHLAGLAALLCAAGAWMWAFRHVGGERLWREWFWENHFGRMTGAAVTLGHNKSGEPLYYIEALAWYTLPWMPALLLWLRALWRGWKTESRVAPQDIFLFAWGWGALILLSLSVTKREIYLAPALPAFALMCARAVQTQDSKWFRGFLLLWSVLGVAVLMLSALSPLWAGFLPAEVGGPARAFLHAPSWRHAAAALLAAGAVFILTRRAWPASSRTAAVSALVYIGLFTVPAKVADLEKGMAADYRDFAAQIPEARRPRVAAWNFSETTRGCFYFYTGLEFPRIGEPARLDRILAGADAQFDSVILAGNKPVADITRASFKVMAAGVRDDKRALQWIEGGK